MVLNCLVGITYRKVPGSELLSKEYIVTRDSTMILMHMTPFDRLEGREIERSETLRVTPALKRQQAQSLKVLLPPVIHICRGVLEDMDGELL